MMTKKKIILNWSEKTDVYDYKKHSLASEYGIYMLTRIWGINSEKEYPEKLLYIGKTSRLFIQRLKDHTSFWVPELRGKIFVRYAPVHLDDNELEDIESALIYETQPAENTAKLKGYTFRSKYLFEITNVGDIGPLPEIIDAFVQLDEGSI